MGKQDFDYRQEGWNPFASSTDDAYSRKGWYSWLAQQACQATMVALCLVVAVASFFGAAQEAGLDSSYWTDATIVNPITLVLAGFLALGAATTRCWWFVLLALLLHVWVIFYQEYGNVQMTAAYTYLIDGCVIAVAVGLLVRWYRRQHRNEDDDPENDDDQCSDHDEEDDHKRSSLSSNGRREPILAEIV